MLNRISTRWVAALLLIIAAPAMVMAQDSDDGGTPKKRWSWVQTVTGTRLPTAASASPVFVLTRAEIDARGLTNIEDIVPLPAAELFHDYERRQLRRSVASVPDRFGHAQSPWPGRGIHLGSR